ncbi:MAG: hypothetical protein J6C12_12260 [Lachnospiraceae bacterium]|nr:hypothetical protein [Lachnospiraceae bacterium]
MRPLYIFLPNLFIFRKSYRIICRSCRCRLSYLSGAENTINRNFQ